MTRISTYDCHGLDWTQANNRSDKIIDTLGKFADVDEHHYNHHIWSQAIGIFEAVHRTFCSNVFLKLLMILYRLYRDSELIMILNCLEADLTRVKLGLHFEWSYFIQRGPRLQISSSPLPVKLEISWNFWD